MTSEARREEIRAVQKKYSWFYALIIGAVLIGVGVGIAASEFADDSRGFWMNLVTEALGVVTSVVITVFVIDRIYERRNEMRRTEELKRRLVREAGSRSNDVAIDALDHLRSEGWLTGEDGLLQGAQLRGANLQGANLREANLQGANLWNAKLDKADCHNTNLQYAFLHNASLQMAELNGANLQESLLMSANLGEAILFHANMQGAFVGNANLSSADLRRVNLIGARLDFATFQAATLTDATLPDGSNYTEGMDIGRFTTPTHPEFMPTHETLEVIRENLGISFYRHFA